MVNRLVIVESPTKARTIEKYLPKGYRVEASMGHVRDLPASASEIPAKYKSEEWARLGVNVAADFAPPQTARSVALEQVEDALGEVGRLGLTAGVVFGPAGSAHEDALPRSCPGRHGRDCQG